MRNSAQLTPAIGLLLAAIGCGDPYLFRCETVLRSDGTVDRAIYQPKITVPIGAQQDKTWEKLYPAPPARRNESVEARPMPRRQKKVETKHDDQFDHDRSVAEQIERAPIRSIPADPRADDRGYLVAWGKFPTVDKIPNHFGLSDRSSAMTGRLERGYKRVDYVFVVEHVWTERRTDGLTLEKMHEAAGKVIELLARKLDGEFASALGQDYDTSRAIDWLRADGSAIAREFVDWLIEFRIRNRTGEFSEPQVQKAFVSFARKHGFELPPDAAGEQFQLHLRDALTKFFRGKIRRRDGKPVSDDVCEGLALFFTGPHTAGSPAARALANRLNQPKGNRENFAREFEPLGEQLFGTNQLLSRRADDRYDFLLTTPGIIVETTGTIEAENQTRWVFHGQTIFPLGYEMRCRALEPNEKLQQQLLGKVSLRNRKAMLEFVSLLQSRPQLVRLLKQCATKGSMASLRDQANRARNTNKRADMESLLRSLGLSE